MQRYGRLEHNPRSGENGKQQENPSPTQISIHRFAIYFKYVNSLHISTGAVD